MFISPIDFIFDLFNPDLAFLGRALIVSLLSSIICGVIGTHVVLRGMAFIGDALAHAVFPGLAVAFLIGGNLMLGGLVAGIITAILVALFAQLRRVKEDTVIGVFFVGAFALGILIISLSPGYSGSLQGFLFGSVTGITMGDIWVVAGGGLLLIIGLALLHKEFVGVNLDREMARAAGLPVLFLDIVLYVMVAIAVVLSLQTIGNVLVLALLVTPAATARLLTDKIVKMMVLSAVIGGVSSVIGLYLSWSLNFPVGGTVVFTLVLLFITAWLFAPRHGMIAKSIRARKSDTNFILGNS